VEAYTFVTDALKSTRWTISGPFDGRQTFERRFGTEFAAYVGTRYCIPTASGTASLMIALEGCGVGRGDEVIIPGLTWVANASTVASVNASIVLSDVLPSTLCIDPDQVAGLISPRTSAIVAVHLYGGLCDLDALSAIAHRNGIPLIEDCAQIHGAQYAGRRCGSLGAAGAFSMQQTKLLTSGEGGALVTNSPDIAIAAERLRADGRNYTVTEPPRGDLELIESGRPMGSNMALSEFQAGILLASLPNLDEQNQMRASSAHFLDVELRQLGFFPQETAPGTTSRSYYKYAVRLPERALHQGIKWFCRATSAELNIPIEPVYDSLADTPLLNLPSRRRFDALPKPQIGALPIARSARKEWLVINHEVLLADQRSMEHVVEAFAKVGQSL
jgi:dTDP-4-amino-4,6-dideoxygalactose transaminase